MLPTPGAIPNLFEHLMLADVAAPDFGCGDCTACCTVLAVTELQKPMRYACQHLCRDGCRVYLERPAGCRQFNCLWLRGAVRFESTSSDTRDNQLERSSECDESLRPDHSGVIWDYFIHGADGTRCLIAFEVWANAFRRPDVLEFLVRISDHFPLRLSFRNSDWADVSNSAELAHVLETRKALL